MKKKQRKLVFEVLEKRTLFTAAPANFSPYPDSSVASTADIGEQAFSACLGEVAKSQVAEDSSICMQRVTDQTTLLSGDVYVTGNVCLDHGLFVGSDTTLHLEKGSKLSIHAGVYKAGIEVADGVTLTIAGTGSLDVHGGACAAGIGSKANESAGSIRIDGGKISVYGGLHAAAIDCENVEIVGGYINLHAGADAFRQIDAISTNNLAVADEMVLLGGDSEAATSQITVEEIDGCHFLSVVKSSALSMDVTVYQVGDNFVFHLPEGTPAGEFILRTRSSDSARWEETEFKNQTVSIPKSKFTSQLEYEIINGNFKVAAGKLDLRRLSAPEFDLNWNFLSSTVSIGFKKDIDTNSTFIKLDGDEALSLNELIKSGKIKKISSCLYTFQPTNGALTVEVSATRKNLDSIVLGQNGEIKSFNIQSETVHRQLDLNIWSLLVRRLSNFRPWKAFNWLRLR